MDHATVVAARDGDPAAVDRLVAGCLPLVYTIVGRALEGHADVDDVVQDVMLRVLRGLADLRDPSAFRSWLVAITVRQLRERFRGRRGAPSALVHEDLRDPGADFTDLAITRLELSGQRRETAEATRWLDEDNRELLSLWWLEASGELTRDEIVSATGLTRQHAAVRIQRMKGQLETARVVVRALAAQPPCDDLRLITVEWDGRPGALWRKRIARHTRDCGHCSSSWNGLVAAERLLAGMALVPAPAGVSGHGGMHLAAKIGFSLSRKVLTAALSTTAVVGGVAVVVIHAAEPPAAGNAAAVVAGATVSPAAVRPSPSASASRSVPASPSSSPPPTRTRPVVITATASPKKGVGVWAFAGAKAALHDVGAGWYYNWASDNDDLPGPADVEYVPMIRGKANVTDATLEQARSEGRQLLGFNEPDMSGQANMTVAEALAAWPRLQATGLRLGSPAVAYGADRPGGWLDRFLTGARSKGYRVDFVTLHWYGSDFGAAAADQFLRYVDAVHQRYGKPIWVTEFGLMNFSGTPRYPAPAQAVAFIKRSTKGLQSRSYVERYAWFGLPAVGDSVDFGLYRDGDSPTEAGKAYRAAG